MLRTADRCSSPELPTCHFLQYPDPVLDSNQGVSAEPFSVSAKLDPTVTTDGPMNPLGDSASIIRIDVVKIILESTPCADSSKTPPKETPPVTPRRETENGGR